MIAEFYIIAESFVQNNTASRTEIEAKIEALGNDFVNIRKYKEENKLIINEEIFDIPFINKVTISDLLYNDEKANQNLDRDARNMLKKIVTETETSKIKSQEVIEELLPIHDQDICHGLIAFNEVEGIEPEFQVVYSHNGWLQFRRHYLKIYPKDENYFIDECIKYFPKLAFHPKNKVSVRYIFPDFACSIVKHLGYLNDTFYTYRKRTFANESEKYRAFSVECQLEEYAASKDKNSAKENLTFDFKNKNDETISVTCYPHLRLCKSDQTGDTKYYQNRIYFHEGFENISDNKILIGHIGVHL